MGAAPARCGTAGRGWGWHVVDWVLDRAVRYDRKMTFFRTALFFLPAACLLAQAPAPVSPAQPQVPSTPSKAAVSSPAVPGNHVVITVGDAKITAAQFEQIIDALPDQYRSMARGPGKKEFAENVVKVLVLAQEGKRRKIDQSPDYLAQSEFQSENLLASKAFAQISDTVKVDDAEVRKYYDAHLKDYEQIHARHILIRAAGSPVPLDAGKKELSDQEALAKAQEIRKKLVDGADFAELAKTESDDSGSKANGGDLNFFHRGQMVPPFEEAAFALKIGEISQPVKTPFGYHIIRLEGKKGYEEAKPEVEKKLKTELAQKSLLDMEKAANPVLDPDFFGPAPPLK